MWGSHFILFYWLKQICSFLNQFNLIWEHLESLIFLISISIFYHNISIHLLAYSRYQYPPLGSIWYTIIGTLIFCVGMLSGIGNGMVVYIFATTPSLRTPSNMLIVNLAFSDFCMVLYMTPVMVYNSIKGTWSLGRY